MIPLNFKLFKKHEVSETYKDESTGVIMHHKPETGYTTLHSEGRLLGSFTADSEILSQAMLQKVREIIFFVRK